MDAIATLAFSSRSVRTWIGDYAGAADFARAGVHVEVPKDPDDADQHWNRMVWSQLLPLFAPPELTVTAHRRRSKSASRNKASMPRQL